jgi:hypothetical protein
MRSGGDCADVLCKVRERTVARFNLKCDGALRVRCVSDFYEIRSEPEFKEAVGIGRKS